MFIEHFHKILLYEKIFRVGSYGRPFLVGKLRSTVSTAWTSFASLIGGGGYVFFDHY